MSVCCKACIVYAPASAAVERQEAVAVGRDAKKIGLVGCQKLTRLPVANLHNGQSAPVVRCYRNAIADNKGSSRLSAYKSKKAVPEPAETDSITSQHELRASLEL